MSRSLVLIFYNLVLPVFFIVAFPAWLIKMWKRGGYGTGLLERFAKFETHLSEEPKDTVYVHAVSVGEVLIALKLIEAWIAKHPEIKIVLAATTSTGHEVAREKSPDRVRVIYSPLDFGWIVRAVFRRFKPQQIVLIEAEAWPNLLNIARKKGIPVSMVNARLSSRSEVRFHKFGALVKPLFTMINQVCVQNVEDAERFKSLGIGSEKIHVTGSIKFDPSGGTAPQKRDSFQKILDDFGATHDGGRQVVLAASTHAGEEKLLGSAHLEAGTNALYVVVPRHAERRADVKADLKSCGFEVVLRSDYHAPKDSKKACLVVDTTGELRGWTAHADLVIIGKSWLGEGGQNPAEAIAAAVPVITGPNMGNFEPLVSMLKKVDGIRMLTSAEKLGDTINELLNEPDLSSNMCERARKVLESHENAVEKTIELLHLNASVR
ncbi:MAG: 3-deoxy-D-manno-octulosonic acid transferase [Akkermansiaceae bacterium]|tara:strand:- start:2371 stop:3675 length:1305 start_codon:yes stop_codon:yes gene_type:complete